MQIKKRLSFLSILIITIGFFTSPYKEILATNKKSKQIDQIILARNLTLKFAQNGYDLINVKEILKDALAQYYDTNASFLKKFSHLFTMKQWQQVKKIIDLKNTFEAEFVEELLQKSSFLISDSIDNKTFKNELIFFEKKIFNFCHHTDLVTTKIGPKGDISDLLNNIHKMISRIETEAHDPYRNITNLLRMKNLIWGTNFSYEVLPELFRFGFGATKVILTASKGRLVKYMIPGAARRMIETIGGDGAFEKFTNFIAENPITGSIIGYGVGLGVETFAIPFISLYKALQTDSYIEYCKNLEIQIKRKQSQFKKAYEKKIRFSNIIGYEKEKEELQPIIEALTNPVRFKCFGAEVPKGLFLIGPPGSGKTLFARAIATEANCSCWSICGSELFGDDEKSAMHKIDELFYLAEITAPSIIVIDELDFVGTRKSDGDKTNSDKAKVLAKLLTKLSGFKTPNPYRPVLVISTANYLENIDPALIRSGRFDIHITLGPPDSHTRKTMFEKQLQDILHLEKYCDTLDLDLLVNLTEGYSFADIVNIVNMARLRAGYRLEEIPSLEDFKTAIEEARNNKDIFCC